MGSPFCSLFSFGSLLNVVVQRSRGRASARIPDLMRQEAAGGGGGCTISMKMAGGGLSNVEETQEMRA